MRRVLVLLFLTAMVLGVAAPSGAIVYGQLDGDDHPSVGGLVVEIVAEGRKDLICSGTLIAPDVFLTAGHCTAFLPSLGISDVWVTFDSTTSNTLVDPIDETETTLIHGSFVTHPDFGYSGPGGQSDPHDIAVVLLDHDASVDYPGISPASLPVSHQFEAMKKAGTLRGTRFTAVGYGVHQRELGGGPPMFPFDGDRWQAVSRFRAIQGPWLHLSQNNATGDGGTCFGDSGSPNFLGSGPSETDVIAAITITGDSVCAATNVVYRLDTPSARAFLDDFVALP